MVVLLLILYYVVFGNSTLTAIWVAVIGFALYLGANNSETPRSGIESISPVSVSQRWRWAAAKTGPFSNSSCPGRSGTYCRSTGARSSLC